MKLNAVGLVRHRFWGEYSASVTLYFDDVNSALMARPVLESKLPKAWMKYHGIGGQRILGGIKTTKPEHRDKILIECTSEDLELIEVVFEALGADRKKIASLAKSVDHGEEFTITVNVEDPRQMTFA